MKIILSEKEKELINKLPCNICFKITKTDCRGILNKITGKELGKNNGFTDMKISLPGTYRGNATIPEEHIYFSSENILKALKNLTKIYNS